MKFRAVLLLVVAAVLFSTSGLFIKITTVTPFYLFGARSLIAAATLFVFVRQIRPPRTSYQWGGALALAFTQLFFIIATRETTAANAIFIQYTAPVYVAFLGAWYLREPVRRPDVWAMGAILIGLFLFLYDDFSPAGLFGTFSALLSGISLAWMMLFLRRAKDESTLNIAFWGNILGALVAIPVLIASPLPSWGDIGAISFLGVFQIGIGLVLLSIAIKHLTAIEAILIQTLEPLLNPIWVFFLVGERPTSLSLLGGLTVLGAVTWRSFKIRQQTSDIRPQNIRHEDF